MRALSKVALLRPPTSDEQIAVMRTHVKSTAEDKPGVYRMIAPDGEIVYVGKSKRVRTRLLSYFRCAFPEEKGARILREAVRITSAAATVHLAGIGDIVDRIASRVDCVTARALAPLHQLVGFAEPFVSNGAKALFLKGQDVEAELTDTTKYWKLGFQLVPSRTGDGVIVVVRSLQRRTG